MTLTTIHEAPARQRGPHRRHGAGMVGVIAQDTARFSMFAASLTGLQVPDGSAIKWEIGHAIAASTNRIVQAMLATTAEWLWILGDDHVFAPDLLLRLLEHDADIVAPLVLTRNPPYKPVMISDWLNAESGWRRYLSLDDHPDGGLVPVHSTGSAGMLVRRHVFEAMADPWFESGGVSGVEIGEDYFFCDKARDAGFGIYGDLDAPMGHITTSTVWPTKDELGWAVGFRFMGGLQMKTRPAEWGTPTTEGEA